MGGVATRPGRGRKPKPTKQKALAGNPGKRKLNEAEPDFGTMTGADAPEWMPDLAGSMWETVVPLLCGQHVSAREPHAMHQSWRSVLATWRRGGGTQRRGRWCRVGKEFGLAIAVAAPTEVEAHDDAESGAIADTKDGAQ